MLSHCPNDRNPSVLLEMTPRLVQETNDLHCVLVLVHLEQLLDGLVLVSVFNGHQLGHQRRVLLLVRLVLSQPVPKFGDQDGHPLANVVLERLKTGDLLAHGTLQVDDALAEVAHDERKLPLIFVVSEKLAEDPRGSFR